MHLPYSLRNIYIIAINIHIYLVGEKLNAFIFLLLIYKLVALFIIIIIILKQTNLIILLSEFIIGRKKIKNLKN
jgi:hypothetical protein